MPSATKKRLAREQTWFDSLNPTTLNVINSLNDTKESNDAAADAEGEAVEARNPVRESGHHRIRSRYNTRGANTNVSSHMKVA